MFFQPRYQRIKSIFLFTFSLLITGNRLQAQEATPVYHRVISMAPNLTEIVYDIGADGQLIGVTDYCKFPPEARLKTPIGGWINPNYEMILSLKPDLILALKFHGQTVEHLRKLHLPVLVLDCQKVRDVLDAYQVLGKALGKEKEADRARRRLERRLARAKRESLGHKPISVLFIIGRNPGTLDQLYGAGSGTFVDEVITWAGGKNILSDATGAYPMVSKEQLIKRDPNIIIDSIPSSEANPKQLEAEKESWKKFPTLKAVQQGHVFILTRDDYLIPGPTLAGLVEYLSGLFNKMDRN